jgi:hypothetical protein
MPSYNSEELKLAVKHNPISKNLAVEKTRIFQRILKYVKELHTSKLSNNDPYRRLEEGKTLLALALHPEAVEVVQKGLKTAVDAEELMAEVQLRELLRVIYKNMNAVIKDKTENEYLLEMASRKLSTLIAYTHINDRAFDYLRRYRVSDAEGLKKGMEELIGRPEMLDVKKANSQPAQERFFSIWNFYHSSRNELEEALRAALKVDKLMASNPARIKLHTGLYLGDLSNIIGKLNTLGRFEDSLPYLRRIEELPVKGKHLELQKFCNLELQYQFYYLNTGRLGDALKREEKIHAGIKRFGNEMKDSFKLTLLYNLGVSHLLNDTPGRALFVFNSIKDLGELRDRIDLQGVARLLRLLLLENQEDEVNFSHYLRNSKRFFSNKDRSYELEKMVYDWLGVQHKLVGTIERKEGYGNLADSVEPLVSRSILGAEEIFIWARAKRRGVSTEKVYKENLKQGS